MTFILKFADKTNRKFFEYKNWRGFQYTKIYSATGKGVFRLDLSETSEQIDVGWNVEIWKDGVIDYNGKVIRFKDKKNVRSIFTIDLIGQLKARNFFKRPSANEASQEIADRLDGYVLNETKLRAWTELDPTGTTKDWHWEYQDFGDYVKSIGEQCVDLGGNPQLFIYWIDPKGNVEFRTFGGAGYYKDLPLQNITLETHTEKSYNYVNVVGFDQIRSPEESDEWTEGNAQEWIAPFTNDVLSDDAVEFRTGLKSVKINNPSTTALVFRRAFSNYKQDGQFIWENWNAIHFSYRWTTVGAIVLDDLQLSATDGSLTHAVEWYAITGSDGTWVNLKTFTRASIDNTIINTLLDNPATTFDLKFVFSGSDDLTVNIDGFYISFDQIENTSFDQESMDLYGRRDLHLDFKEFITDAECKVVADIFLAHYKDPQLKFTASLDGYHNLRPNSSVEFMHKGIKYVKVLKSITHMVSVDGRESTNITIEDYKKDNVDSLREKLQEILKNFRLLQ